MRGGSGNNTFIGRALINDMYGEAGIDTYILTAGTSSNIFDGQGVNNYSFGTGINEGALQLSSAMSSSTLTLNFGGGSVFSFANAVGGGGAGSGEMKDESSVYYGSNG